MTEKSEKIEENDSRNVNNMNEIFENDKKTEEQLESSEPQVPKGIGISFKLFFSILVIFALLLVFVLVMIFNYRGNKDKKDLTTQSTLVGHQSGLSADVAISQLNHDKSEGVLVNQTGQVAQSVNSEEKQPSQNLPSFTELPAPSSTPVQVNQDISQAARSPISVQNNFQGPQIIPILSESNDNQNNAGVSSIPSTDNSSTPGMGESYQQQNMQSNKVAFLKSNNQKGNSFYLDSELTKPISPYEVKAGAIIPATLLTGIDSDLPGQITAQVSQNVYDTVTGNFLLIPQGTKIIGVYDSQVAYGQDRVLIAWSRLIYPTGDSFDLEGQPGVDLAGMAGLEDLVNNHYLRIFGSAVAFSMFGAAGQLSQPKQADNAYPSNSQIIYGAVGQNLTEAGAKMTEKNMNIQPTITIRPGANFNVLLTRDMVLPGPYQGTN